MELFNLRPVSVEFELCGIPLEFRPYSVADDLKSYDICGSPEGVAKAFKEYDFEKICLLAWYQLTPESQRIIIEKTSAIEFHPKTGKEQPKHSTPIERLNALFICIDDQISLIGNLSKCKGLNIPDPEDRESLGKWLDQINELRKLTGQ